MENENTDLFREEFIEQIEDCLVTQLQNIKDVIQVFKLNLDEMQENYTSNDSQYVEILEDDLPNSFTKSHFILICSFLEQSLVTICKHLKKLLNKKLSLDDLKGKGCEQCKNYLKKVIGIDIPNDGWSKIMLYNQLRNYIVHSESVLLENRTEKINKLLKRLNGIKSVKVENQKKINISHVFLEETIIDMDKFLRDLFKEIKNLIVDLKKG